MSEITKNHGKEHSTNLRVSKGLCALTLAIGLSLSSYAFAADPVDLGNNGSAAYDAKGNLTVGNQVKGLGDNKKGQYNTAIGTNTDTLRNVTKGDITTKGQAMDADNTKLVDGEGKAHKLDTSTESGGSTAIGYNNKAEGDSSTAIGNTAKIINKPVTYYADKDGKKTTSTDDAAWYKDSSGNPTQVPQVFRDADGNTTTTPQYIHTYTEKDPDTGAETTKTEITSDAAKADQKDGKPVYNYQKSDNLDKLYSVTLYQAASNSIAAGTKVTANGSNAVAVGYSSTADNSAVAIGDTAAAKENGVAIGKKTTATENAVAIGNNTKANVEGSIALGKGSEADRTGGTAGWDPKTDTTSTQSGLAWKSTEGALSIGNGSVSRQITGVAAGSEDTDAVNLAQLKNAMTHYYSVKTTADTDAAGNNNYLNDGATGNNALAAGVSAVALGDNATAVGTSANATTSQATAIGSSASATSSKSTAIGTNAGAHGDYATAIGSSASATSSKSTAIGYNAGAHGESATALGNGSSATNDKATAIGNSSSATSNQSTAVGNNAGAHGDSATALGNGASATNTQATAIGSGSAASGSYAIAMGNGSSSTDSSTIAIGNGAGAHGDYATALGSGSSATSPQSTAIGSGAGAHEDYATALGSGSSATSPQSTAIGSGAGAHGTYATALGNGTAANTSYDTAIGGSASAGGGNATALGYNAKANNSYATALGNNAKSNASGGIALGSNSTVYRGSGTTGLDPRTGKAYTDTSDKTWNSSYGALSIGNVDSDGTVNGTRQIIGVAAGTNDTDAVNVAQLKAAMTQSGSIHDYSVNSTDTANDTNYSNAGATGKNALAAGVSASATAENAVAIGYGAQAEGKGATVIGKNAKATGQYATAFGGLETTDKKGTLINIVNTASGNSSTAFGQGAQARGTASLAFGHNTIAGGADGSGQQSVAFGEDTQALGGRSLAFGEKTIAKYNDSVAFGNDTRASSTGATSFGNRTRALAQYSTAWGNATVAADEESTAWGTDTIAGAKLDDNGAVTNIYTYKNNPDDKDEPLKTATEKMDVHGNLAYIQNGKTAGVKQMQIDSGTELHDYVVLAGKDGNTYIRDYQGSLWKVNVDANGNVTIDTSSGTNGKVYNGQKKTSSAKTTINGTEVDITPDNVLTKAHEGTNGYNIDGYANATAFGYSTEASGDNATAFGNDTKAIAAGATAFGYKTTASGENSTAFGESSIAAAKNSLAALGGVVDETATNAAAIGNGAEAKLADSIALGSGALANRSSGSIGYDVLTGKASSDTSAAWVSSANAIAVGNDTEGSLMTRQITGVAAGSLDTDAVNVAQLKAAGLSFTTNTKDASNTTDNYKGYKVVSRRLGDTIAIKAGDEADNHSYSTANLTTRIAENGDISILMDEKPTFTSVTTGDVIFAGNPDLTDKDGKAAKADTNVHYGTKTLTDGQNITSAGNDTQATRLHYKDDQGHTYEVATMDDGQIYAGDIKTDGTLDNTGFARTMNQKTTINGGVTNKDNLTDNNIGVVSNGTDTLTVKLAKELKDLTSVTTGKTVLNDSGITITNDAHDPNKTVAVKGDEVTFGGNQVTNMGSGINTVTKQYDTPSNGANIGDVKNIANSTTDAAKLTGDSNITVTYNDQTAGGKNTVKLNDSITLGSDAGKKVTIDGTKGTITAGDKVSFDGSTGIGSIGGVTIGSQTGVATTKTDGGKAKTEDGTFVTGLTNTTWNPDANGIVSGRAATEDQLKTVSDTVNAGWELDVNGGKQKDVTPTSKKVNFKQGQNIIISGSGDDVTVATDDNVRFTTINVTGDKDASGSYTGGITIGKQSGGNSANPGPGYYITGLDNTSWNSAQIQSGRAATEDQLKQVAEDIKHGTVDGDKYITGGNATYAENGDGSAKLTGTNGLEGTISNLHDYYVTQGVVSDDGKKLTMTKNDGTTFDINLDKVMQSDMRLVKNPGSADGAYTVDNDGNLTLTVQDANGTEATKQTITLSGLASKAEVDKGLNFAANSGTAYNAKMGGKVTIKGSDAKAGHDYSADNLTTEVDTNGNITIKLDKDMTANTVTVSGKDGKDGQIGITGKDGADGTVTTIIKTIGKNGTDGTNGTAGVNGTDGITRIVYQDGKDGDAGTTTYTVATLDDGLKFGANTPVAGKTANPVGNKLNSTINVKGAGTKELDKYSGQNLLTSVEQADDGTTTINILMDKNISADSVVVGQEGKAGKDGKDGYIGINGKDGADGITTTLIRTEKGQSGADGKNGKPGVDGTDITRIVYQNGQDGTDGKNTHTVATLDDGLKFAGDDGQNDDTKVITKKLNERLDIVGKAQGDLTDANIGVTKDDNGKLYIRLAKNVNLDKDGTLQAGDAKIGHFSNTELTTNKGNHPVDGSYTIGLGNTDWNVTDPEYVSGRAATEDQLAKVSEAITNATTAAGKRTVVTVNDKSNPAEANPGANAYGDYDSNNGNLMIAAKKDSDGLMTYNIKLNDQLAIGQKGEPGVPGKDGKDGKVTVETKGGTTVVIGHDGKDGDNGKDGLFVTGEDGKDGKSGVSITGPDGVDGKVGIAGKDGKDAVSITGRDGIGHIGLTGQKGEDGKDGAFTDLSTILGTATLDPAKNEQSKSNDTVSADDKSSRIQYQTTVTDKDGNTKTVITHEVATMDDGLKFAGDDVNTTVDKKLNDTLQIRGDGTYNAATKKSDGNIQTTVEGGTIKVALNKDINLKQDGSLTIGGDKQDDSTESKDPIVIKRFDDKTLDMITGVGKDGKPIIAKEGKAGDYITGLDNKDWNVTNPTYVSGRAATEDQLKTISDAVNKAASTAGMHTVVTVNDKDSNETTASVGTDGKYGSYSDSTKGNLLIASKDENGKTTYNIKLNDQLAIGQKGEPGVAGKDGKDGKVTVDTKGGTTVVIGHDGEPGKDGKDGISVKGQDGKDGVIIAAVNGKDGTEGHIGLTGPKGADGKNANIDISTVFGKTTLDRSQNEVQGDDKDGAKDQASRIQYQTTVTTEDGKPKTITHEVATMDDGMKYAGDFGNGASIKLNKTVTIKGNVAKDKTEDNFVDGNIAVVANKSGEDGELLIKLNKDLTGLNSATYTTSTKNGDVTTTSTTVVDGTGLKIENGPSITNTGIDGGNHQITNVASGKNGNMYDTKVKGQEKWNNAANIGDVTNIANSAADGVKAKSGKNITVGTDNKVNLNDNITLGDDKTKQVSISGNDAKITAGDGNNKVTVDGLKGQIVAGGDQGVKIGKIAEGDSSLTIYDKDGNATKGTDKAGQYVTNLDNKTWNGSYVSGRAATEDQLHQLESSFNTKVDAVEQNHTAVTVNGSVEAPDAGANGTLGNYTDEKKGNLLLAQKKDSTGKITYDLKLNDKVTLGKAGTNGKDGVDGSIGLKGADGQSSIGLNGKDGISVIGADGKNGVSITGSNGLDGKNGVDGKIAIGTPGKEGQPGKDAISISGQNGEGHIGLTGPAGKDGKDASADIHVVNGQVGVDGTDGHGGTDGMDRVVYEDHNGTPHKVATMDDGMKYGDDFGNTAKVKLNHQLDIVGDINAGKKDGDKKATKDDLSDGNIGIIATDTTYNDDGTVKENGKMTVKLAKDLKGLNSIESNSVTTGNTTINNGGLTIKTGDENRNITVQDGNVNMGGNQIHNVAPGQAPGDAVNVGQLNATNQTVANLGGAVNKLGTRVNRVGAGAAALAALHPLDFDPDDKWDFAAGYGNYKDASAVAVGAYYRPNEDTMFSVGGSFGGGENMVNAGVSFKVGQGNHVSTSRVAMAKEIKDLRQDVANLNAIVNRQSALIDKLTGTNAGTIQDAGNDLFPDVPANHWAYEYVTKLKQAGILTGYPDGNFDGDRMMTRYEFAAIVYRAIMAGAASNPALSQDGTLDKLAKEFSPEMKHIRIDTIAKDKNGKPTIERVRVIPEAQQ